GRLKDREIQIQTSAAIVPYLWVHAAAAAYNLVPISETRFVSCAETFFVLEPMRQINATSIARSLHCIKPQIDQIRRGKGDVTIPTLKGHLVHALFDRMLEEAADAEAAYRDLLPGFLVPLASVTDEFFNEE